MACKEEPSWSAHSERGSGGGRGERRWPRRACGGELSGASTADLELDAAHSWSKSLQRQSMTVSLDRDSFHSSVGMGFEPGSQVVLWNWSSNNVSVSCHLAGYGTAP